MPQMSWLARQDGYDPNAFDVPGEQSTGVGWANRMGEILTTRPQYDETVQYKTASPLVNITEGDIGRATEAAMAVSGGGMKVETPRGIRAYHSSPHDFDKFDLAKIGTGEGAQSYGHGLYFAESPAVSGQGGQYWNQFMRKFGDTEYLAANKLKQAGFDRDAAALMAQKEIDALTDAVKTGTHPPGVSGGPFDEHTNRSIAKNMLYDRQQQLDMLRSGKPVGPRTYEVNINADPAHMLDWDKGLYQQSPHVQDVLARYGMKAEPDKMKAYTDALYDALHKTDTNVRLPPQPFDATGPELYRSGKLSPRRSASEASNALNNAGIPGIKYLDQGSRGASKDIPGLEAAIVGVKEKLQDLTPKNHGQLIDYHQANLARWQAELAHAKANPPTSNYVIFDPNIIRIDKKYAVPGAIGAGGMGALAAQNQYEEVY